MISVIIPVYRAKKTIKRCVESVLSQKYRDFELILVDDGSDDGSGETCDELAKGDDRIRVLHGKNGGAAHARNKGVKEASGDWICFIDSDDVVSKDYLEVLISLASDHEADIAACAYIECTETQVSDNKDIFKMADRGQTGFRTVCRREQVTVYNGHEGVKALLYQKGFISAPWGMISKKELWKEVSFPEGYAAEDMGTIYRLFLAAKRIVRTEDKLYGYVLSAGNTVFSTSAKRNPDYYRHSKKMLKEIKQNYPDCLKSACSRHLSACFQILSETASDTQDEKSRVLIKKIYKDIFALRRIVTGDGKARIRNRAAALLSYINIGMIHRKLHERYLKSIPGSGSSLAMVEYQGRCDEEGRAVGHAPKVLRDYLSMISDTFDVTVYAPDVIIKELERSLGNIYELPHRIVMKGHPSLGDRIFNKIRMFLNIDRALKHGNADVYWFFNVEFYLFLYLALFGNHGKRIVVTLFYEGYNTGALAGIKQKIFEAGQKRVFRCMAAGSGFMYRNMESVFIPDYVCDGSYKEWRTKKKEDYVVCLGTMDRGKQLDELVRAFSSMSYRLLIVGRFYDKGWLEELRECATENVEIRDEYPDRNDYLDLLGRASYAVLPYNKDNYSTQTSGVMQEAVFTGTVVLTHRDILKGNGILGVGYTSYEELSDELLSEEKEANSRRNSYILAEYETLRQTVYDPATVRERMKKSLSV